jgi:hypothetical protein
MSENLDKTYPEDERLRQIRENPDRRMTRAEWEREDSRARQTAHKKHEQVKHDRQVQQEHDRKKRSQDRNWKKILLWVGAGVGVLLLIFLIGYIPRHEREKKPLHWPSSVSRSSLRSRLCRSGERERQGS